MCIEEEKKEEEEEEEKKKEEEEKDRGDVRGLWVGRTRQAT